MVPSGCILDWSAGRTKMTNAQAKTIRSEINLLGIELEALVADYEDGDRQSGALRAAIRNQKKAIRSREAQLTEAL